MENAWRIRNRGQSRRNHGVKLRPDSVLGVKRGGRESGEEGDKTRHHRPGHPETDRIAALLGHLGRVAREQGMRTLRDDGMLKVLDGVTTLEEILRVVV